MHFDKLCTIAERHMPEMIPLLERARLFVFPGRAHELLPKAYDEEEVAFMREHFFLPFKTIVVEDKATCTVLWDSVKNQRGIDGKRFFIECVPMGGNPEDFDDDMALEDARREYAAMEKEWLDGSLISVGVIQRMTAKSGEKVTLFGGVNWSMVASKHTIFVKPFPPQKAHDMDAAIKSVLKNVRASIEEVFYFNNPTRFVLETRPAKVKLPKKKKGKKKLLRSHNRPTYTMLSPQEIREKLGIESNGKAVKKTPHERRRHYRTYPDDPAKWPKAHGKRLVVAAAWIGPDEVVKDGKRYKVRLDL